MMIFRNSQSIDRWGSEALRRLFRWALNGFFRESTSLAASKSSSAAPYDRWKSKKCWFSINNFVCRETFTCEKRDEVSGIENKSKSVNLANLGLEEIKNIQSGISKVEVGTGESEGYTLPVSLVTLRYQWTFNSSWRGWNYWQRLILQPPGWSQSGPAVLGGSSGHCQSSHVINIIVWYIFHYIFHFVCTGDQNSDQLDDG